MVAFLRLENEAQLHANKCAKFKADRMVHVCWGYTPRCDPAGDMTRLGLGFIGDPADYKPVDTVKHCKPADTVKHCKPAETVRLDS